MVAFGREISTDGQGEIFYKALGFSPGWYYSFKMKKAILSGYAAVVSTELVEV